MNNKPNPEPTGQFTKDITKAIKLASQNNDIILMLINANESIENKTGISKVVADCKLADIQTINTQPHNHTKHFKILKRNETHQLRLNI